MRLWSIHPSLLDTAGLNAAWREGLMAQSVIVKIQAGQKPGYANHPQLQRFLQSPAPLCLIGTWLTSIHNEATKRGYSYDYSKIVSPSEMFRLTVTSKQVHFEFQHLQAKLKQRDHDKYGQNDRNEQVLVHPMFIVMSGDIEKWEKVK